MIQSAAVQATKNRAATISIISNALLTVMKLIVGIVMQSVSVISEAGHTLAHQITADIEQCLPHSHIPVHIGPCPGGYNACAVECPKLDINFQALS